MRSSWPPSAPRAGWAVAPSGRRAGAWTQEYEQLGTSYVAGETDSRVVASATGTTPAATWTTTGGAWAAVLAVFKATTSAATLSTDAGSYAVTGSDATLAALGSGGLQTPLKLLIAGVDRTGWLANGYSIDIEKVLSSETFHFAILDLDSTAGRVPARRRRGHPADADERPRLRHRAAVRRRDRERRRRADHRRCRDGDAHPLSRPDGARRSGVHPAAHLRVGDRLRSLQGDLRRVPRARRACLSSVRPPAGRCCRSCASRTS